MTWRWIDRRALLLLHAESLAEHGGGEGLRDEGLLESALARPENLAAYGQPDFADLAASYGFGVAKSNPFVDGNKRAAFLAVGLFLSQWPSAARDPSRSHAHHAGAGQW